MATSTFSGPDVPDRALIDACVHCGFCLPACPTYLLWQEEMDSPRGRIYLMKGAVDGRAALTPTFVSHIDACLGCLACVTACPSGVSVRDSVANFFRRSSSNAAPSRSGSRSYARASASVVDPGA